MKIIFITQNQFGVRGTTGTYRLIEELYIHNDVLVIETNNTSHRHLIVHNNNRINTISTENKPVPHLLLTIRNTILSFAPDIIYLFNSSLSLIILFHLKHLFPDIKWIADIRTPLLQTGDCRKRIRQQYFLLQFYVDSIITLSRHSAKTWIPFLVRKTVVIPMGTDSGKFATKKIDTPVFRCRKFVFAGSLHKFRKLDLLIQWFYKATQKNEELTLDIYGSGPAERELDKLITSLDAGEKITMRGQVSQETLFQQLCTYDAGIAYIPYERYNRSPSLKSIEYAAAGIHVLASDTMAHKQQKKDQQLNFQLFANQEKSFLHAIRQCSEQGVRKEQLQKNLNNISSCDFATIIKERVSPLLCRISRKR